jgi:hypothetical protein
MSIEINYMAALWHIDVTLLCVAALRLGNTALKDGSFCFRNMPLRNNSFSLVEEYKTHTCWLQTSDAQKQCQKHDWQQKWSKITKNRLF